MKMLRVMGKEGDAVIQFDESQATAADRAKAETVFNDWMKENNHAFLTQRKNGEPDCRVTSFNQIEEGAETILFKRITAG